MDTRQCTEGHDLRTVVRLGEAGSADYCVATLALTCDHAASSYGQPVAVIELLSVDSDDEIDVTRIETWGRDVTSCGIYSVGMALGRVDVSGTRILREFPAGDRCDACHQAWREWLQ